MTLPEYLGWISKNLHKYLACLSFPVPPINPNRVVPFLWPFSYRAPCKFACSVNMPWEYLSLFFNLKVPLTHLSIALHLPRQKLPCLISNAQYISQIFMHNCCCLKGNVFPFGYHFSKNDIYSRSKGNGDFNNVEYCHHFVAPHPLH